MPLRMSRLVSGLPATIPFVGPEVLERRSGTRYRLRLGANESNFGPSPKAIAAMTAALQEASLYGDPESYEVRAAIGDRLDLDTANVSVACGIDDLQSIAVRAFMDPGEAAVMSQGAYPTFAYHVTGAGGRIETVPYRDDRNDVEALLKKARETEARFLFLANPDNPTGSYLGAAEQRALLEQLPERTLLILDEAYLEFAPDDRLPLDVDDPRLIRFRTFSKAYGMAGMRIGYALGEKETMSAFDRVRLHFGVNRVSQVGAIAAWADQEFLVEVVEAVAEGRRDYARLAQSLGIPALESHANFVSLDMGTRERALAVLQELARRGVFVRMPGAPPVDRCVRVTVGKPEERRLFAEIFSEVIRSLPVAAL